ncbi:hypothetical protein NM688_g2131 [Phlebia brevispora]|uniref:Uncharacterized protein n=1 Tax=Phlebia brevispora TaxID=194682 RepID=A0ACC1T9I7_9APHY|nr:hypothetical protein NM688_g2131 [Phlebia brevispora]
MATSAGIQCSQDSASFIRRLAGPSIMKAGLAKDQTEINRVIAEASKGSKFYELAKMEAQRDLTQTIVHVDMDAFYANVELLDNPELAGKPFAVGHGVVSTASYEARKYGVRSGMPEFIARKLCPELIVKSVHFPRYMDSSRKVMDIFRRYDPNMFAAGCDEGYLNITRYCEVHHLLADECVQRMREEVFKETKLTVSAGIAPNKMLAKVRISLNKPNGQFMLHFEPDEIKAFMRHLPIRKIPGVGRVNERLLDSIGIKTCGDIYTHRAAISLMDKQFGLHFLLQTYLGIASNVVQPGQREERKSIGAERTFTAIGDKTRILAKLEEVAAELEEDMERTGWTGKTVTLKYKLDTYQVFTRAKSFDRWISTKKEDLFAIGKELLLPELPLKIRLIGLRVTKLKDMRADVDSKPGSIKRFFEKANGPSSPRKKQCVDPEQDGDSEPRLSQDGYEDSMPGYHDDNDDDDDELNVPHELSDDERDLHADADAVHSSRPSADVSPSPAGSSSNALISPSKTSRKPISSISRTETCEPESSGVRKPLSGPKRSRPRSRSPLSQMLTCPICSKTMETDNRGLNEHIDFCLSKGAIREAQAMASTRRSPFELSGPVSRANQGNSKKRKVKHS